MKWNRRFSSFLMLVFALGAIGLFLCSSSVHAQKKADGAKSPPEALNLFNDAANFQNKGAFEVAAEDWDKFLKKFPKDPLAVKARHYLGVCNLQLKRYDVAAAAFEEIVAKHPTFEQIEEAHLNLGWCRLSLASDKNPKMYALAAQTFNTLVNKFPKGGFVDQALFFQGEALVALNKNEQAAKAYERLIKNHPKSPLRADGLYALGASLEELSRFPEAGRIYDLFLKEFPRHELTVEVGMRKAESVLQAGDFAGAEKMFAAAASAKGFASADHATYRQAYCASKQDKFVRAGDLYAKIPAQFAQSGYVEEAKIAAGRCYYRAEKFDEALGWFEQVAAAKNPHVAEAAHWLCRIYLKRGQAAAAGQLAEKTLSSAADSPFLVSLKLDRADAIYEDESRRADSLALYEKIAADHADHELAPQALYNAAFAALGLKKFDVALRDSVAFAGRYKDHSLAADANYVAAESRLQLQQYPEAEKLFAALVAKNGQHPDASQWRLRLGLVLHLSKKYPQAIQTLNGSLARFTTPEQLAEAQFLIGSGLFYQDQFEGSGKALQASLAAKADWRQADEALLLLSRVEQRLKRFDQARAHIAKVIANYPQSNVLDQAYYRQAEYSYEAGDLEAALSQYNALLSNKPDSLYAPYAVHGKGWALLKLQQFAPAAESFTALLNKFPRHKLASEGRFARAICFRQTERYQEAIADLSAYLKGEIDLQHKSDALHERGLAESALKDYAASIATFSALLQENPKYPAADKAVYELAWAYKSSLKNDEAAAAFARLAASYPQSDLAGEAHFHVGENHYQNGRYDQAVLAYQQAGKLAEAGQLKEKSVYKLGWSQFQLKQYEVAQKSFVWQVENYPQGPLYSDGLFMKAECLFKQEDYKAALSAYRAAQQTELSSEEIKTLVLLHGGQSAAQLENWEQSLAMLRRIPANFADSPYLAEARYEMGWAKQRSGDTDEALKEYAAAAEKSRSAVGARARFMIGEIQFERKSYVQAIQHFQRVMYGYGSEQAADDVKIWQAKSGYEAGRCSEVQIRGAKSAQQRARLIAEAKKYYGYVLQKHPQDSLAAQAKKSLAAINKL